MNTCGKCKWAWTKELGKMKWHPFREDDESGACFFNPVSLDTGAIDSIYFGMPGCSCFEQREDATE